LLRLAHWIEHRDVRPPNVLWNSEDRKVMLVDFEADADSPGGVAQPEVSIPL
jgi:serine/threonine protein kinase